MIILCITSVLQATVISTVMELTAKESLLELNPDTVQYLRKQYDLDKQGRIEEAVNLLDDWIQKQAHFMRKDFSRDYLERTIIISKGSVERAKKKLDSICTFRTLYPEIFAVHDIKNFQTLKDVHGAFLPKLTNDHYRVLLAKIKAQKLSNGLMEFYQYYAMLCEYVQAYDYCNGLVTVFDYTEANILEVIKALNVADLQKCVTITKDAYGMRIKGIHFITNSKTIEAVIALCKKAFGPKLGGRIVSHSSVDTLYDYIPKDILPVEYGGEGKPLSEQHNTYIDTLTSKTFTDYLAEMNRACTDEKLRANDDHCLGVPGSFRTLSFD